MADNLEVKSATQDEVALDEHLGWSSDVNSTDEEAMPNDDSSGKKKSNRGRRQSRRKRQTLVLIGSSSQATKLNIDIKDVKFLSTLFSHYKRVTERPTKQTCTQAVFKEGQIYSNNNNNNNNNNKINKIETMKVKKRWCMYLFVGEHKSEMKERAKQCKPDEMAWKVKTVTKMPQLKKEKETNRMDNATAIATATTTTESTNPSTFDTVMNMKESINKGQLPTITESVTVASEAKEEKSVGFQLEKNTVSKALKPKALEKVTCLTWGPATLVKHGCLSKYCAVAYSGGIVRIYQLVEDISDPNGPETFTKDLNSPDHYKDRKNAEMDMEQYIDLKCIDSFDLPKCEKCVCMKFNDRLVKWPTYTIQLACIVFYSIQLQDSHAIRIDMLKNIPIETCLHPSIEVIPHLLDFSFCNCYLWITGHMRFRRQKGREGRPRKLHEVASTSSMFCLILYTHNIYTYIHIYIYVYVYVNVYYSSCIPYYIPKCKNIYIYMFIFICITKRSVVKESEDIRNENISQEEANKKGQYVGCLAFVDVDNFPDKVAFSTSDHQSYPDLNQEKLESFFKDNVLSIAWPSKLAELLDSLLNQKAASVERTSTLSLASLSAFQNEHDFKPKMFEQQQVTFDSM
ncbi:hypothetical protein RFI_10854, partial [Reticulomyxa filosa]